MKFSELQIGEAYFFLYNDSFVFFPHKKDDQFVYGVFVTITKKEKGCVENKIIPKNNWDTRDLIWKRFEKNTANNRRHAIQKVFQ